MKKLFFLVSFLGVLTFFNAQTVDVGNPVGWNGKLIDKDIPIQSMPGYDQAIIDQETDAWGIKVTNVELKDIDLDESMIRVIAKQAEAERNRRAKLIHADGELQASQKLLEAAQTLSKEPQALQLRYLQTLNNSHLLQIVRH